MAEMTEEITRTTSRFLDSNEILKSKERIIKTYEDSLRDLGIPQQLSFEVLGNEIYVYKACDCDGKTELAIPSFVKGIRLKAAEEPYEEDKGAFQECHLIEKLTISESFGDNLALMGLRMKAYRFELECKSPVIAVANGLFWKAEIKSLELRGFNTSRVIRMASAFHKASVPLIDLSENDFGSLKDASGMFEGATTEFIDISSIDILSVNRSGMFKDCSATRVKCRSARDAITLQQEYPRVEFYI